MNDVNSTTFITPYFGAGDTRVRALLNANGAACFQFDGEEEEILTESSVIFDIATLDALDALADRMEEWDGNQDCDADPTLLHDELVEWIHSVTYPRRKVLENLEEEYANFKRKPTLNSLARYLNAEDAVNEANWTNDDYVEPHGDFQTLAKFVIGYEECANDDFFGQVKQEDGSWDVLYYRDFCPEWKVFNIEERQ